MKSTKHSMLEAAYMFYYATDVAFEPSADASGNLSKRLHVLITDLLITANNVSEAWGRFFAVTKRLTIRLSVTFRRDSMWSTR